MSKRGLRLLLVAPVGSAMHIPLESRVANQAVGPQTEVVVRHLDGVPNSVYVPPEEVFLPRLVDAVMQGEADGFDAIGISCCSDPGLNACRDAVGVPVSAPFEAVSKLLPALGRLGIMYMSVAAVDGESELRGEEWIPELLETYACASSIGPILPVRVERPAVDFSTPGATPDAVGEALIASMGAAIDGPGLACAHEAAGGGATAVFPTCTYWSGLLNNVRKQVDITVLDPLEALSRYLESVVSATT